MSIFRLERARKALTNAEIKALPSTGITLVAAPGAGFFINPLAVTLYADTSSGAYTNINATFAALEVRYATGQYATSPIYDDSSLASPLAYLTDLLGGAADKVARLLPTHGTIPAEEYWFNPHAYDRTNIENDALEIKMDNNGSGALTGGHASNTLTVTVTYLVEPI